MFEKMTRLGRLSCVAAACLALGSVAQAAIVIDTVHVGDAGSTGYGSVSYVVINQWASTVIGCSSFYYYSGSGSRWTPSQALGAPNVPSYGDNGNAWAGYYADNNEWITLGYDTPVYATGATVRESYCNGFVYQIDALDTNDVLHTVWTGTDTSVRGTLADFTVSWSPTDYLVKGLKVYVNGKTVTGDYEEIDAVSLAGTTAVPEPMSLAILAPGVWVCLLRRKRQG